MAGAGQRFVDAGYPTPKPLIPVDGQPMIINATEGLPEADEHIFLCRSQHIDDVKINKVLENHFPKTKIIKVEELTEGQASTCLLAREKLHLDDILFIGACDNDMIYNRDQFESELSNPDIDAFIWTFRQNPAVLENPKMYGWVKTDDQGFAKEVSVKIPISNTPMNDHAVIGAFTFKRAQDFLDACDEMIRQNRRINNEFYVDMAMNLAIEKGLKVKVFEVKAYLCWGTPRELENYNYWKNIFQQRLSLKN
jgi:dTDP-glucose pyrophosphorylase